MCIVCSASEAEKNIRALLATVATRKHKVRGAIAIKAYLKTLMKTQWCCRLYWSIGVESLKDAAANRMRNAIAQLSATHAREMRYLGYILRILELLVESPEESWEALFNEVCELVDMIRRDEL